MIRRIDKSELVDSFVFRLAQKMAEYYKQGNIGMTRLYLHKLSWVMYMDKDYIDTPAFEIDDKGVLRKGVM